MAPGEETRLFALNVRESADNTEWLVQWWAQDSTE